MYKSGWWLLIGSMNLYPVSACENEVCGFTIVKSIAMMPRYYIFFLSIILFRCTPRSLIPTSMRDIYIKRIKLITKPHLFTARSRVDESAQRISNWTWNDGLNEHRCNAKTALQALKPTDRKRIKKENAMYFKCYVSVFVVPWKWLGVCVCCVCQSRWWLPLITTKPKRRYLCKYTHRFDTNMTHRHIFEWFIFAGAIF